VKPRGEKKNRDGNLLFVEKNTRQTVRHLIRYLPSVVVPSVFGLVAVAIYTRILSPEEYGIYILIFTTALFLQVFTLNWLYQSILRYYERYQASDIAALFTTSLVFFCAVSLLTAVIFLCVHHFSAKMFDRRLAEALIFLPLVYVGECGFKFILVFLRAMQESLRYSVHLSINAVLKLAVALVFILLLGYQSEGILLGLALASGAAFLWEALRLARRWRPAARRFSVRLGSQMLRFGLPLLGLVLLNLILSVSDRYLLQIYQDAAQVGIYSAGYRIAETGVYGFVMLLNLAAFPVLIKVFESEGEHRSKTLVNHLLIFYLALLFPVVTGISVLSEEIVTVMLGPQYRAARDLLPWVSSGIAFMGLGLYYAKCFELKEKTFVIPVLYIGPAVLNLLLNLWWIPRWGMQGAAVSTFLAYLSCLLLLALTSRKMIRWQFPWLTAAKSAMASLVMGMVVHLLPDIGSGWLSLGIKIAAGAGTYLMVLALMEKRILQTAKTLFTDRTIDPEAAK
jgi:O-antigen/teichoic acid export membrane protein